MPGYQLLPQEITPTGAVLENIIAAHASVPRNSALHFRLLREFRNDPAGCAAIRQGLHGRQMNALLPTTSVLPVEIFSMIFLTLADIASCTDYMWWLGYGAVPPSHYDCRLGRRSSMEQIAYCRPLVRDLGTWAAFFSHMSAANGEIWRSACARCGLVTSERYQVLPLKGCYTGLAVPFQCRLPPSA